MMSASLALNPTSSMTPAVPVIGLQQIAPVPTLQSLPEPLPRACSKPITTTAHPADSRPCSPPPMTRFGVARTHQQVLACWELVYNSYTESDLIDPNPMGLHTSLQATHPQSTVIFGRTRGKIDATLTVIADGDAGLPLDTVYSSILNQLRQSGRKLVEVGLLADARTQVRKFDCPLKTDAQMFGTMRYGVYRAISLQADIVIGVRPSHTAFYKRMFGMKIIGPLSQYPMVKNRPVIPMLLDISRIRLEPLPRLLRFIKSAPLASSIFAGRYQFTPRSLGQSPVSQLLEYRQNQQKISQFLNLDDSMPMNQMASI